MITILSVGTRGDTQPYIALALELKKLGYQVRIAAGNSFGDFIKSYGIGFAPILSEMTSIDRDSEVIKKAMKADNPLKLLLSFHKMKDYSALMMGDLYTACEGSELVIYHPGAAIGYFAAKKMGIPSVMATPFPLNKTKEYPSVILYGKIKPNPFMNGLSYIILQTALWMASKSAVKAFWKKKFGVVPEDYRCPFELQTTERLPTITSCSSFVFPRPRDWNENIHQSGYWFVGDDAEYTPSTELADFLDAGEPPIYVGFGSAFDSEESERTTQTVIDALKIAGKRGVLATGWSGMKNTGNLPDSIFMLESIPHSWLFKRVSAVIHHGGAGTTAAGFKAGLPSVITPFGNDQHAWGQRAYDLGVGSKPIPIGKLTADNLAGAITFALGDEIVSNAKQLGEKIGTENGAADAATVIGKCLEQWT